MSNTLEETLEQKIRNIIKSPMRSKISTADIAVGMMSSTNLSEKVHDLKSLILSEAQRIGFEVIGTPLTYAHMDLDRIEGSYDTAFEQGSEKTVELQRRRLLELTGGKE